MSYMYQSKVDTSFLILINFQCNLKSFTICGEHFINKKNLEMKVEILHYLKNFSMCPKILRIM